LQPPPHRQQAPGSSGSRGVARLVFHSHSYSTLPEPNIRRAVPAPPIQPQ
jgi:hypothetical protein